MLSDKKKQTPMGAQWSPDLAENLVGRGEDEKSRSVSNKPAGDSFEKHTPVAREAKRTPEIKQRGPVANRDDYKTLNRAMLPSSDFDKSLGLSPTPAV